METTITSRERMAIQAATGWSEAIINALGSAQEAEIYMKAGLIEAVVAGRPALISPRIKGDEFNCRDTWYGKYHPSYQEWSNEDLMGEGFPPHDRDGDCFELHHIGQKMDSPLAELTGTQHMGEGNNPILHPVRESEVDREAFREERSLHWMDRYRILKEEQNQN